jgi:hypothetical protein
MAPVLHENAFDRPPNRGPGLQQVSPPHAKLEQGQSAHHLSPISIVSNANIGFIIMQKTQQ